MKFLLYNVLTRSPMTLLLTFVLVGPLVAKTRHIDFRESLCAIATGASGCTTDSLPHPTLADAMGLCDGNAPTTKAGKCLLECNWRFHNITNDKGFQHEIYMFGQQNEDATHMTAVREIVKECMNKKDPKNDKCETAAIIADCLHNEGKKWNIFDLGYDAFYIPPLY